MSTHEKSLRIKLLEAIHQFKIKQIEVAREANVHHSTLSLYLQGKVRPNPRVEQALDQWLQRLQQNPDLKFARNPEAKGLGGDHHGLKPGVARNDFNRVHEVAKRDEEEDLVPVRIDLEFEGRRFRENIVWNANEKNIQADFFARQMAIDNDLPPVFENEIVMVIQKAVQTHRKYVPQQPELLKIIELDLRLENICLKDRFEWDINDPNNVPEDFALLLCNDLGLNHEFVTIIAHSIREQIEGYRKEVIETGGEALANMKKSMRFLIESSQKLMSSSLNKTLETKQITEENYLRQAKPVYYEGDEDGLAYWEPKIEVLDPEDLEKVEKLENRKLRYEKRRR